MDNPTTINQRYQYIRETLLHCSQKEVAATLGITQSGISRLENRHTETLSATGLLFANVFNVNPNWLLTGTGKIFALRSDFALDTIRAHYDLSEEKFKFIKSFLDAQSVSDRDYLLDTIRFQYNLTEKDYRFILHFLDITPSQRKIFLDVFDSHK